MFSVCIISIFNLIGVHGLMSHGFTLYLKNIFIVSIKYA